MINELGNVVSFLVSAWDVEIPSWAFLVSITEVLTDNKFVNGLWSVPLIAKFPLTNKSLSMETFVLIPKFKSLKIAVQT